MLLVLDQYRSYLMIPLVIYEHTKPLSTSITQFATCRRYRGFPISEYCIELICSLEIGVIKRTLEEMSDLVLRQPRVERLATLSQLVERNLVAVFPELCDNSYNGIRRLAPCLLRGDDLI